MRTLHAAFILARILIGGIFVYTGVIHLADIEGFSRAIGAYDLLPPWSIHPFAHLLPLAELLAGLSIATGLLFRAGSLVATLLLASFTVALSVSLYRGLDISCGCFSTSTEAARISWMDLIRDLALLASSSFLFLHASMSGQGVLRAPAGKYLVPVLTGLLVSGTIVLQLHTRNPCENVTLETVNRHRSFPSAVMLSKRPVENLCEVLLQRDGEKVSVYVGKSFLVIGEMFRENASLTAQGFMQLPSRAFLASRHDLDQVAAVRYTPEGEIGHTLYMFSGVDCPHCRKALEELPPLLDETGTELKILLMGWGGSRAKTIKALCLKMDLDSYLLENWIGQQAGIEACEQGEALLQKTLDLGSLLGVTSVPAFFTQDGIMISGSNLKVLENLLWRGS